MTGSPVDATGLFVYETGSTFQGVRMKIVLTPRRHAVPLKPGERLPTPEENLARIAEGSPSQR